MAVSEALAHYVLTRDGGCVARFVNSRFWANRWPMLQGLPDPGPCRTAFGALRAPEERSGLTLDHVKTELAMSKRAPDDRFHLWAVCPWHHVNTSWVTHADVREAARAYIIAANAAADLAGWPIAP